QRFEIVNYNAPPTHSNEGGEDSPRPYQPRQYNNQQGGYNRYNNRQGGYNNNRQGGYNNHQQGGYNNRYNQGGYNNDRQPYGNRYNNNYDRNNYRQRTNDDEQPAVTTGESTTGGQYQREGGYQPRHYNNSRQGGYNNNRQGGYNNNRQGGYNNNRQGGYNNNRQGGYNNNRQSGYNNNRQGGYNNNRQGGYNNNRQGGYNNQQGGYNNRFNNNQQQRPGRSFTPRPKRVEYEMPIPDPNEQIRLNKFLANAGLCSRREADEYIQQGLVKVNGEVVTELGTKISHNDTVEYDGKVVALESKCYILLNKPKDCVTTSDDPNGRLTVMDLVKGACDERIYPVGRLDRNTTGVLLLTNDGDLASKLTHPKFIKKKIYHVWCDKDITEDDMQRIADGIELEDGPIHADAISYATEKDRNQAGIEIHSGRNRIVRRIFESLGYHVTKLDRVYFAGLTKKNLPRGRWRYLTQDEVNFLKMGSFE
ncbi:MAG: RNA-binding S4 domain-containing protein, partial [Muribaculaceae bacterium]|nr:RNA-binding S4 domain-containing protein [Muribaculaceae bacterium]